MLIVTQLAWSMAFAFTVFYVVRVLASSPFSHQDTNNIHRHEKFATQAVYWLGAVLLLTLLLWYQTGSNNEAWRNQLFGWFCGLIAAQLLLFAWLRYLFNGLQTDSHGADAMLGIMSALIAEFHGCFFCYYLWQL